MAQAVSRPQPPYTIRPAVEEDGARLRELLREARLTEDGVDEVLAAGGFVVAVADARVMAAAGVEAHGRRGLLRSVVVSPERRGTGVGAALVHDRLEWSRRCGLTELYLLTETARDFFARRGFTRIERSAAPAEIQRSDEFARLCPESATVMVRSLADA